MKNLGKKIISISLVIILVWGFFNLSSANVQADEKKIVKVGFFEVGAFQYYDEYGKQQGYNVDYLNLIANYTGWSYEFVEVDDMEDGLEMLENHEIDLIAPALLSEARYAKFDYSNFSLGTGYYAIVSKADGEEYEYDDFESLEGKTISVPEGSPITDEFYKFMKLKNLNMQITECPTLNEAVQNMMSGETDYAITPVVAVDERYNIISKFCSSLTYYLTWKDNDEFLDELNNAMEYVETTYANELEKIRETYLAADTYVHYTKEEKEFLENCGTISLGYVQGRIPLSFKDNKNELSGISRSIFDRISEITGLEFEYVPISYGTISLDYFKENEIDLISGVAYNNANISAKKLHLSVPYISSMKVFVGREDVEFDTDSSFKVAITTGSETFPKVLKEKYPKAQCVVYDNIEDCFEAVRKGKVDFLVHNQYSVDYMMSQPINENLIIIPAEGMDDELCFSSVVYEDSKLSEEEQIILIGILDKAIAQITQGEMDSILVSDTLKYRYEFTAMDILYKYRYLFIVAVSAFIVIMSTLIYIICTNLKHNRKHKKEAALLSIQKKRYQLILDKSDDMMYEISLQENAGVSSEQIKALFGWEIPRQVDDLMYDTLMKVLHVHPDDVDRLFDEYGKDFALHGIETDTVQLKCRNNEYLWCKISMVPLYDEDKNLISYVGKIKDVDEEVRHSQEQEQRFTENAIQAETFEELLGSALMDNLTDIMRISMKTWKGVVYLIHDGKLVERALDMEWDVMFDRMISNMVDEDRQRLYDIGDKTKLANAEVGTKFTYHYKTYFDIYRRSVSDKCFYYTTTFTVVNINNEKNVIIINMDDTEIMSKEQAYDKQREEFVSQLIASQKFLYNAIDYSAVSAFIIYSSEGDIYTLNANENGKMDTDKLEITWDEFCEKELFPYMDNKAVAKFKKAAASKVLNTRLTNDNFSISFKAKLDAKTMDPAEEENWFKFNFRVIEYNGNKAVSVVIICNSDNVKREIEEHKSAESKFRQLRMNALIERNDEIIYDFNLHEKSCIVNGNEQNTFGWSVGKTIENITIEKIMNLWGVHPEDRFKIGEASQNLFKKNTSQIRNIRVQKSDGEFVWAKISSVPIIDEGEMVFIMCRLSKIDVDREENMDSETELNTDSLTGLLNSKSLNELTEKYLTEHSAKNDAFILIDLDHFKTFNDNMDMLVGDKVIKDTAHKLQIIFSNYDYIGRFTGDEFGVFVKNIPLKTLEDKLTWALEKLKDSYTQGGKIMQITASIGVAYSMSEKADYQELYHLADNAVYEAKKSGREKFIIKKYFS